MLSPAFVSALEMSALDHMRMNAAVQPCIDTAISKTVNVPVDYPFEAFEDLYFEAWRAGLKGIATYRPLLREHAMKNWRNPRSTRSASFVVSAG